MTDSAQPGTHPVLACADMVATALKDAAGVDPIFMTTTDKRTALLRLHRLAAQVAELELRVLATADDVAADEGMRDPAAWLTHHAHLDPPDARRRQRLAKALAAHPVTTAALRDGEADVRQVETITRALAELPDDVAPEVRARAEEHLVAEAASFAPGDLRTLGRRVLAVVAPDVADEHERRLLEKLGAHAEAVTRLSTRTNTDGTTDLRARIPDHAARRLMTYLHAYTSPRRPDDDGARSRHSHPEQVGRAFVSLLEHLDPKRLPLHGGDATTVVVTIDLETLTRDLDAAAPGAGVAHEDDQPVSPGHARRLACTAGIVPAVLDGEGRVLDLGRAQRLYQPAQRRALALRDTTCRGEGCTIPAAWCEAHHLQLWSRGGRTDLETGVLLCSQHHHRIHDSRYTWQRGPDGRIAFRRRPT